MEKQQQRTRTPEQRYTEFNKISTHTHTPLANKACCD